MAYNAFIKIDQTRIGRLPFLGEAYQYWFVGQGEKVNVGIVYTMSRDNYVKAEQRLRGVDTKEPIKAGDKVFIMPGSYIPHFKIKDHCKKIGASVTADIDKATYFIATDKASQTIETAYTQLRASSLIFDNSCSRIAKTEEIRKVESKSKKTETYSSIPEYAFLDKSLVSGDIDEDVSDSDYSRYYITPAGAMILYNAIAKKIPIVHESTLLDQISPVSVIDEVMYAGISDMLGSSDDSNHEVAVDIIANSDINKSLYYLWKIGREYRSALNNGSGIKNVRLFIKKSNWQEMINLDEEEFIQYMDRKGLLTREYFAELVIEARKNYENTVDSNVFELQVKPSARYKQFLESPDEFSVTYTKEPEIEEVTELEEEFEPETNDEP